MAEPLFEIESDIPREDLRGDVTPVLARTAVTEREMLDLLGKRYSQVVGNGPRWAVAEHVRSHAGFDARRTADLVAMDLWPSSGLALHGHEVKVSRSDWLRELKEPDKAAEFMQIVDYWWLVAPAGVVAGKQELPDGWGMLELAVRTVGRTMRDDDGAYRPHRVTEEYLRVVKSAPRLAPTFPREVSRSFFAAFSRSLTRTATRAAVNA